MPLYSRSKKVKPASSQLGELNDIEINVNVFTPWHLWDFLTNAPRVEILYHSIHYIDLVKTCWAIHNRCMPKQPGINPCRSYHLYAAILLWIMVKW